MHRAVRLGDVHEPAAHARNRPRLSFHNSKEGRGKVLGAGVSSVVVLLSKEFVALVLLANFVAWPLAWYAMNRWLEGFAYRIDLGWMIFALAGGLALLIALATVSLQTIKAALANPVDSLRCE
ncbi:MAG: ABC transporter permease [bacterium]